MGRKKFNKIFYIYALFFFTGLSSGVILIWPGILKFENRECFFNILKDGSDGAVKIGTLFSINPNYLVKIKKNKNKYIKILLIGDSCFRRF